MDIYGKIKEKIRKIAGECPVAVFPAEVVSVSGSVCSVKLDELPISDVRLRSVINNNNEQILITPKAGSYVLVVDLSGGNYRDLAVIGFSEVEKLEYKDTQGFEVIIKDGKMSVKNSSYGIKQAIDELIDAIGKLTVTTGVGPSGIPINKAEFEAIKQKLNNLLS
jgi:hypothetical protein